MEKECYIECEVRKGFFSDELMVRFKILDHDGRESFVHAFVSESVVIREPESGGRGKLKATCIASEGDNVSVVLPQPTMESGPCVIIPAQYVTC